MLEASGDYRVLRRLVPRRHPHLVDGSATRIGLFADVETTGLDPGRHELIELSMVSFTYALDGRIFAVGDAFQRLRQPAEPIPREISVITGIDNAMVAGQTIEPAEVDAFAAPAALVIAHNAAFDRRFLERFCPLFARKPWACSLAQVDWAAEGHEGLKLVCLAAGAGFFYDRHRAERECPCRHRAVGDPAAQERHPPHPTPGTGVQADLAHLCGRLTL